MTRERNLGVNPLTLSVVVLVLLTLAGFAALVATATQMGTEPRSTQVSFAVSGSLAGMGLIGLGLGLLTVQVRRRREADDAGLYELALVAAAGLRGDEVDR